MNITLAEIKTVGDLRRFLKDNPQIPDTMKLQSFGPDTGGYDFMVSNDVMAAVVGDELLIGAGDEQDRAVWDSDQHRNIIGRVTYHPVVAELPEFADDRGHTDLPKIRALEAAGVQMNDLKIHNQS